MKIENMFLLAGLIAVVALGVAPVRADTIAFADQLGQQNGGTWGVSTDFTGVTGVVYLAGTIKFNTPGGYSFPSSTTEVNLYTTERSGPGTGIDVQSFARVGSDQHTAGKRTWASQAGGSAGAQTGDLLENTLMTSVIKVDLDNRKISTFTSNTITLSMLETAPENAADQTPLDFWIGIAADVEIDRIRLGGNNPLGSTATVDFENWTLYYNGASPFATPTAPEPASAALLLTSLLGLGLVRRRRR